MTRPHSLPRTRESRGSIVGCRLRLWVPAFAGTNGVLALALITLVALTGHSRAQEQFPNRLVTIIAPITPGTAIDIMARLYADKLS